MREVLMGAQDNLTNVLAVVLGVAIGTGRSHTVTLAGLAAGVGEAISMGGVLLTATRAEEGLRARDSGGPAQPSRAAKAGAITFVAALVAGLIPLAPIALMSIGWAMLTSVVLWLGALFLLGSWAGRMMLRSWWGEGLRILAVASVAAVAAATIGAALKR